MEAVYAAEKSFEGTAGAAGGQPAADGALVGTSRQTISQLERGDYSPSVTLALKLARVCGVTVEELFEYEEETTDGNQETQ